MKITRKDYANGTINAVDISNCRTYTNWLCGSNVLGFIDARRMHDVLKDNREAFKTIWGKPDWYWRGEFHFHVWVREWDGETFIVLTAKGKGTCIEMVRPKNNKRVYGVTTKGPKIISFIGSILKEMR